MSVGRLLLGLFFVAVGISHFLRPGFFMPIVPPPLPPKEAVYASGAAEILGGLTALHPGWRRFSRWWLIATLLAVFPANIYQALAQVPLGGNAPPRAVLWARLPLQFLFIWWVWRVTAPPGDGSGTPDSTGEKK